MKTQTVRSLTTLSIIAGALLFVVAGCATREQPASAQTGFAATDGAYPLKTCVVTDEDLGKEPYVFTHNGKTVKLCCKDCLKDFKKDPAKYMKKLDEAAAKAKK